MRDRLYFSLPAYLAYRHCRHNDRWLFCAMRSPRLAVSLFRTQQAFLFRRSALPIARSASLTLVGRLIALVLGEYIAPGDRQRVAILDDRKLVKAVWKLDPVSRLRPIRLGSIASRSCAPGRQTKRAVLFAKPTAPDQRAAVRGAMGLG